LLDGFDKLSAWHEAFFGEIAVTDTLGGLAPLALRLCLVAFYTTDSGLVSVMALQSHRRWTYLQVMQPFFDLAMGQLATKSKQPIGCEGCSKVMGVGSGMLVLG
jgi:hypothetical protein